MAQTIVTYNFGKNGWNDLPDTADKVREIAAIDGVTVHIAGAGGQAADSAEAFAGIDGTLLFASLGVVILILLFTYRSPMLWMLPIFSAVVALMTSEAVIYFLAKNFGLTVNGQSQGILTVLVVGAGTDYALLLVARYREELRRHEDRHEAMAFALHRAAPAIFASAGTVVVGMLCLVPGRDELHRRARTGQRDRRRGHPAGDGDAAAGAARHHRALGLLAAAARPSRSAEPTSTGFWARVGQRIAPRPRQVWVGTALVLGVACLGMLPARRLRAQHRRPVHQGVRQPQGPVAADSSTGWSTRPTRIQVVSNATSSSGGRRAGHGPRPGRAQHAIPAVGRGRPRHGHRAGRRRLTSRPSTWSKQVRDAVHGVDGADALVGGTSAIYLDIQTASHRDNLVIIPVVLLVVMLILMLLLRALISPLILIATVILSFGTALGLSTLLFQEVYTRLFDHGNGFNHADASFPLFVFVFLVALGIDYNIFLMTRVREETADCGAPVKGSLVALSATGRRDHLGGPGAGGDVRGARHAAAGVPRGDGHGRRAGRHPRHHDRALGAGDGAQPRPRGARSGGRASSTAATRPRELPESRGRRMPWPTEAGQRSTRAPAPPVALPWAAWGSRGPASACCYGCGNSRGGGCVSAAVG